MPYYHHRLIFFIIFSSGIVVAKLTENYNFLEGASGTFVGGATYVNAEEIFTVPLGGSCNGTYNCKASYAECVNQTCTCLDGFVKLKNGTCQTTRLYCPNLKAGSPKPLNPKQLKTCYKLPDQNETVGCATSNDTNRAQEFCFLHPLTKTTNGAQIGHCCPKPVLGSKIDFGVCPVHRSFVPNMACEGCYEFGEQCVSFKHWSSANSYSFNSQCCPLPCRTTTTHDMISVNGFCYLNKYFGETCELDLQCATTNSHCVGTVVDQKACQCKNGYGAKNDSEAPSWQSISKRTICVEMQT
uniref:EB domain-containing protein n=1 Tax=Romanomermis culicivorax TaxID=13658 RepID=A0A915I032_ROMCU